MPSPSPIYGGRDPRDLPAYTSADVARLTRVPPATVRAWAFGREYPSKSGKQRSLPVLSLPDAHGKYLSFTNLVEAHVLAGLRAAYGMRLDRVRPAVDLVGRALGIAHPLASNRFLTDGVDLFVDHLGEILNVSRNGQVAIREVVERSLDRIEVDESGMGCRFFPLLRAEGGPKSVVVDPRISFGRPSVAGRGIPTAVLHSRWRGGESIGELAADYDLTTDLVEDALRCEDQLAAA